MNWVATAAVLQLTEMHLEAWQQAVKQARVILQSVPADQRLERLEDLLDTARVLMTTLQFEQNRLIEARSRRLATMFALPGDDLVPRGKGGG